MPKRNQYGKPPKVQGKVVTRDRNHITVTTRVPRTIKNTPDEFMVRFVPQQVVLARQHVRADHWDQIQVGDTLSLPSKRGERLWGRAMTPRRKRHRWVISLTGYSVQRF